MPLYELECGSCHRRFEASESLAEMEKGAHPPCPSCGAKEVERVFSVFTPRTSRKS